jgi:hypothetical protein
MNSTGSERIKEVFKSMGYAFFEKGDFNLNIIGIRNMNDRDANTFNDELHLIYNENGQEVHKVYEFTTDPGLSYRTKPMNAKGCAILVPGQYRSAYAIGMHKGYKALVQKKNLKVYRDGNKDRKLDFDTMTIEEGNSFGINIHKAEKIPENVNTWSAGCQVFKKSADFAEFIKICEKSAKLYGDSFTYTLITTDEINNGM